jgi:hypothetical protein
VAGAFQTDTPAKPARPDDGIASDAFGAGEIGPVGGKPFLHGFTATLAVFLSD